jgi:hypothetical protein
MVAGVNAGLAQEVFSLAMPADEREEFEASYRFKVRGVPGAAHVRSIGWGELTVDVALWPSEDCDRWLQCGAQAGFLVGEAVASGWLERKTGKWLQRHTLSSWFFRCRRARIDRVAALRVKPNGYADTGRFFL